MAAEADRPPTAPGSEAAGPGRAEAGAAGGGQAGDPFAERPELYVGAAFVGGVALAQLVRLIGR